MTSDGTSRDWRAWHEPYDDPDSHLSRRLRVVQELVGRALDDAPPGPLRAVSACAGQGLDLLPVLASHTRGRDVTARLVEMDANNAELARSFVMGAGLDRVEVVTGDASSSSAYEGAVPADLVLVCGVFGNIPDDDVRHTVAFLPALCAPGATVIWTRHRMAPDLTVDIRRWLGESGFEEVAFMAPEDTFFGVGAHRLTGEPLPFTPDERLFSFFR